MKEPIKDMIHTHASLHAKNKFEQGKDGEVEMGVASGFSRRSEAVEYLPV